MSSKVKSTAASKRKANEVSASAKGKEKVVEVAEPPAKRCKDGDLLVKGDISEPTIDFRDLSELDRVVIKTVNSRQGLRWNLFVRNKKEDGSPSDTISPFRWSFSEYHKLSMPPKQWERDNGNSGANKKAQPFALSIPLGLQDEVDAAFIKFMEELRLRIAAYLLEDTKFKEWAEREGLEITLETFDNPNFWKGPLSWWSGCVDLKARCEFGFDGKPTHIIIDNSVEEQRRLFQAANIVKGDGICGTFTNATFYAMVMDVLDKDIGEKVRSPMVGMTTAVTILIRIDANQMEKIAPGGEVDNGEEVSALNAGGWKQLSILNSLKKISK